MNTMGTDRRRFLKSIGLAGAAFATPSLLAACAKSDEGAPAGGAGGAGPVDKQAITLVGLFGTSGSQAQLGQEALDGLKLVPAAYGNKVLDRDVKVVNYDTQELIDDAVRRARESSSGGADFFVGGTLSSVALAVGEEVNKSSGLFVTSAGADEITGKECRTGTVRWSVATHGAIEETVRPMIEADPSLKRWYTITPDYVFGHALLRNAQAIFKEKGVEHVGNSMHGLDTTEFSGHVNNAIAAKPDVLCVLNFGAQSTTTLKQAISFGVKNKMKILLAWGGGLSQFRAIGPDALEGVFVGAQYWHTVDTPGNKELVELYRKEHNKNPSYGVAMGWVGGKLLVEGMKKAGSTEPAAVVKALEGLEYEGLTGKETVRAGDHQVIKNYYLLKGKAKSAMADGDDLMEMVSDGKTALSLDQTGCTLKPLGS